MSCQVQLVSFTTSLPAHFPLYESRSRQPSWLERSDPLEQGHCGEFNKGVRRVKGNQHVLVEYPGASCCWKQVIPAWVCGRKEKKQWTSGRSSQLPERAAQDGLGPLMEDHNHCQLVQEGAWTKHPNIFLIFPFNLLSGSSVSQNSQKPQDKGEQLMESIEDSAQGAAQNEGWKGKWRPFSTLSHLSHQAVSLVFRLSGFYYKCVIYVCCFLYFFECKIRLRIRK